jgi:hypothetical protein
MHSTKKVSSCWWLGLLAGFSYTMVQYQLWRSIRVAWHGTNDEELVAVYNDGHHRLTTIKQPRATMLSSARTMILFVTSKDNDLNRKRIAEMSRMFKNNFMVVWSNAETSTCPFQDMKDAGLCLDQYEVSKSHRLSHMCCAQEMAFMWAIENRHSFDHVWLMEDDVYATDISELEQLINLDSPVDLLHHQATATGDFHPFQDEWLYANEVLRDAKGLFNTSEMKTSILNLFRMSIDLLAALEEVYIDLGKEWFFFEALLPSVVVSNRFNLTHASWLQQLQQDTNSTYVMTVTPRCMTHFEKPGIFHPVKYQDGSYMPCPLRLYAPDVTEGSPYKNQV